MQEKIMSDQDMINKFRSECGEIIQSLNLELYDFVLNSPRNTELKIFIRRPGTQSADINDCVQVDRALTDCIDHASWLPESFNLEVSSPGVYRKLATLEHYQEAQGDRVKVQLKSHLVSGDGEKLGKSHIGVIKSVDLDNQEVLFDLEKIKNIKMKFEDIKSTNIEPNWDDISPST